MSRRFALLNGKAEDKLKLFKDNTFHTAITSPPYWQLRDYFVDGQLGRESTPEEYVDNLVSICREVKRVLRKDGTFWLNIGDGYNNSSGFSRASKQFKRKGREGGSADRKAFKHPEIKTKDLIGIPWMVAFALRKDGWYLRCDIIWCLSGGMKVYAKVDNKIKNITIKDLTRCDPTTVQLWNGSKWTQLLGISVSPRTGKEMSFELRNGERIACTSNHKWPTNRGLVEAGHLKVGDIIEKCILPESDNCTYPDSLSDEDIGWLIGMYLAEGSKSRRNGKTKNIQISSHQKEVNRYDRLNKIAKSFGGVYKKYNVSDNGMTINIHSSIIESIIDTYIGGRTAKTKYLKSICWNRSNIFLDNLLKGYLEGDGHEDLKNKRWRIGFARNYNLESDLRTICARLGYKIKLSLSVSKIKEKEYKTFRGEIRFCRSNHFNNKEETEITHIKINDGGGRSFYYDIGVEDDPHLFALSSGLLTHNSKTNPMPDGAKDRPTRGHEYLFLLTKSPKYYYDYYGILEDTENQPEKPMGFGANEQEGTFRQDMERVFEHYGKRNKRSVWKTSVSSFKGKHYATFPVDLIDPCVKGSISEKGCCSECMAPWKRTFEKYKEPSNNRKGYILRLIETGWKPTCKCGTTPTESCIVLDPFSGMATTGIVTIHNMQDYVGIELNKEYLEISRDRLAQAGSSSCFNEEGEDNDFIKRFLK